MNTHSTATKCIAGIIIILIILVVVWFLHSNDLEKLSTVTEPITIGAMLILSGESGSWGQASQRGIEMAVQETNDGDGIKGKKIEVIYEDTRGHVSDAVKVYNKLVNVDSVQAIIGPNFQTEVGAIAPLADDDDLPIITPSYAPISERSNPRNPLMIWLNPTTQAHRMAEYVYEQGIRTVSVVGTHDSWEQEVSSAFADSFAELSGSVLVMEILQTDQQDVGTELTKLQKGNPEAIFIGSYYQFIPVVKALVEIGYDGKLYSIEVDEYLASETSQFSTGLQFISSDSYKDDFNEKYEKLYGEKANIPAGQSYDAANILISFLRESQTKEDLIEQMEQFEEYRGVSGLITITDDHKTLLPTAIYELDKGNIEKVIAY